jgi:RNA polymerase sigma-70 factor (ECF subfamily)
VSPLAPLRLRRAPSGSASDGRPLTGQPTDAELAVLARERDPRGATLIWDRYASLVRGVLHRSLGPGHEIDDLLQDVFLGFFKNVGLLREVSSVRPFLIGIATRTALTELRKRRVRRWLRLSDNGVLEDRPATDGDPHAKEAMRRLYVLLDELADRERLAFVLRHAEGYELTETATLLGVSLATVKRLLHRAETFVEARAREDDLLCAWTERTDE